MINTLAVCLLKKEELVEYTGCVFVEAGGAC